MKKKTDKNNELFKRPMNGTVCFEKFASVKKNLKKKNIYLYIFE
jgi:hypothetical protein